MAAAVRTVRFNEIARIGDPNFSRSIRTLGNTSAQVGGALLSPLSRLALFGGLAVPTLSELQTHRISFDLSHTLYAGRSGVGLDGLISLGMLQIAYADEYHDDVTVFAGTLALALGF